MRAQPARTTMVIAAALLVGGPGLAQARPARPDPLAVEAGCERYRGVPVGANDSTQQFELSVCPVAEGVRAKVQTSSLVSGWSVRASTGSWDAAGRVLTLVETEFIESRPEPGWRFCLIDELVLEKTDEGLEGTYVSRPCDDRAELRLERLESDAAPTPGSIDAGSVDARPELPRPPTPAPEVTPTIEPTPPTAGGCACSAATSGGGESLIGVAILLAVARVRRRRLPRLV